MSNILLVEDDINICSINKQAIEREGDSVFIANTAKECFEILINTEIDLILLDINLPDINGLELCKIIKEKTDIPIIFLTAMGESSDIVKGLNIGADDYMTKPYNLEVMMARIKARLREKPSETKITIDKLVLDRMSASAHFDGKDMLLTKREFLLLWYLSYQEGKLISREEIYEKVWGSPAIDNYNSLRILVSRVKNKLIDIGSPIQIVSKRQGGYVLINERGTFLF